MLTSMDAIHITSAIATKSTARINASTTTVATIIPIAPAIN